MIKKLLKTLIVTSVFLLILTMTFVPKVNAEVWSGGGNGNPFVPGSGGPSDCFRKVFAFGVRITIVDINSGQRISGTKTIDYWQNVSTAKHGPDILKIEGFDYGHFGYHSKQETINGISTIAQYSWDDSNNKLLQDIGIMSTTNYAAKTYDATDTVYGNNCANDVRQELDIWFQNKEKTKIAKILTNAGVTGNNTEEIINKSKNYVIQIEPLMATGQTFACNSSQDGKRIGTPTQYSLHWDQVYNNYILKVTSYWYPYIFAKKSAGYTKVANLNLCDSVIADNVSRATIATDSCIAVSLYRIKDIVDDLCPTEYESNKTAILGNRTVRNEFMSRYNLPNDFDSSGNLGGLSDLALTLYGAPSNGDLACGTYSCNDNANAIYNKFFSSNPTMYNSLITQMYNKSGEKYNLLLTQFWQVANPSGPTCGKTESCLATKDINCDTASNKVLVISDSNEKRCWYTNEIGYNNQSSHIIPIKAKDTGCVDGVEDSCNTYRDTGCKIVCRQTVTFEFPGNVVNKVKAGMVFKWGTDNNKSTSLFGKMKVKMTCQVKSNGNDCRTHKRIHRANDKCYHKSSWKDSKSGFVCYGDWEDQEVDDLSSCKTTYPPGHAKAGECKEYNKKTQYRCKEIHSFDWATWVPAHGYLNSTVKLPDLSNLDTKVNIDYNLRYSVNGDLEKTLISGESQNNGATVTCYKGAKNNCKLGGLDISTHTRDVVGTYELKYTKKFNWYSSKLDGTLYDKSDYDSKTSSDSSKKSFYYYIGYSMPTSFKTHSGTYNDKLVATVSNVGFNDHFDSLLGGTGSFVYSCGLKIHNEIYDNECYDENGNLLPNAPAYCLPSNDPKGIDVVFREVQLINGSTDKHIRYAFPGAKANAFSSGKPRQKGANWAVLTNQEIYNVLNVNVYNNKPMYEIKLDTRVITNIRDINKKAKNKNKDPYSGMHDMSGNNKTLAGGFIGYKCLDGVNGKYCASSFLSELYNKYGLTGECIWTSNTSDRANRIANGTYKKCKNV